MSIDIIVMYSVVSFFYIVSSPGPAVFLALANGMSADMKAVTLSSLGNMLGLFSLSAISIIGLGTLILASATLFLGVKILGAAYLVYLGIKQLRCSKVIESSYLKSFAPEERANNSYFLEGLFLAATNPKAIIFFIVIFPQFLKIESPLLPQFCIMTVIFMVISFLTLLSYGFVAKSARKIFSNRVGMKWFHRITGGIFIGMGVALLQLKNAQS